MILLNDCLIDVLEPEEGIFPYYEAFLSRYSLITVTAIVSQGNLDPRNYEGMPKEDMDREIDEAIQALPGWSEKKRAMHRYFSLGAHIDQGEVIQENEHRTFASELFTEDAKKYSLSNREMILRGLNASTFLNYFFLIEDSLKKIYIDLANPRNNLIRGSQVIKKCLRQIITEADIVQIFEKELFARSKIFFDVRSLEIMWSLLNLIRNQIAHTNGFYDNKAKRLLTKRIENLVKHYSGNNEYSLSITEIQFDLDKYEDQVKKTGYLVVDDTLENIIRSISIFIMESLYVSYREKVHAKD